MSKIEDQRQRKLFPESKAKHQEKNEKPGSPFGYVINDNGDILIGYNEYELRFRVINGKLLKPTIMADRRIHNPEKVLPANILNQAYAIAKDRLLSNKEL